MPLRGCGTAKDTSDPFLFTKIGNQVVRLLTFGLAPVLSQFAVNFAEEDRER